MSLAEVSRSTRVPLDSVWLIENDRFDELPGEVFVRGFLKAYAKSVGLSADDVLARYTASRRSGWVAPLPTPTPSKPARGRRFGVAIAFVLLLILFTLALSIVLKPRGHDMPQELSRSSIPSAPDVAAGPCTAGPCTAGPCTAGHCTAGHCAAGHFGALGARRAS